ncbi:Cobyrinic acid a,c-diamide synthase [Paraburkholderia tropica]|uniref:ParA family protein n=1 Tax=Paraburkholderia tropica TaxID=92647 RepID=UPI001CADC641|nr:AAA family ATPase [Paraburkholderia tropica]CAG9235746.1 Cobyrinic acid a,c-diamide synthase [Paraburkholderia tropica]
MAANDLQANRLPGVDQSVSIDDLVALSGQAADILDQIRDAMLEPYPRKKAPTFTSASLASLCGIDKQKLKYLTTKGELPAGTSKGAGRAKEFSLEEAIQWIQATSGAKRQAKPTGARARVYAIANFKGGVTKTTTSIACAQGLTLLGRKVLVVDCDPQGSATQLCGFAPETEIPEDQTLLPLFYGEQESVGYAIRPTYWHNLDLIPATTYLSDAEFEVPAKLLSDRKFEFWDILNKGLKPVLADYDVVIIDTPPALSQLTTNALVSADAILLPCPPEGMDFASSTQFWRLFSEVASKLPGVSAHKRYDFVNVLMTKVRSTDLSRAVQEWLTKAYGSRVLPISIPESSVQVGAAAMLSTVYDVAKSEVSSSAYARIREPFDRLVEYLDSQLVRAWLKENEQ